ncbi:MAG: FAD:protein FMN transferase, partial [SAR324 cluster bacterium]|nr:FAD:protein FMN transferase [SAR324 cluster bacterium]
PCQILIDTEDKIHARHLGEIAQQEALRIEKEFSRYRKDNLIYKINHSNGYPLKVNQELAGLLDYAANCYEISDGQFDITSGILRKVWSFDCSDNIPEQSKITPLLKNIGGAPRYLA